VSGLVSCKMGDYLWMCKPPRYTLPLTNQGAHLQIISTYLYLELYMTTNQSSWPTEPRVGKRSIGDGWGTTRENS